MNQFELFGAPEEKSYGGVNSVELPYWEENGKITSVALSAELIVPVTYQKGGHIYAYVPGWGRQEKRGKNAKINFLSAMALIRHSMELTESIAGHTQSAAEHNQSAARDAQQLGKLLRAAEAKSREMEVENTRLREELESVRNQKPARWINTAAVEWALDQELPTAIKLVLVTFAACADEHRESWPAVKNIAKKSKMAPETVRTAIGFLVASGLLIDTGKKGGETRQVTIYRLPGTDVKGVAVTTPLKGAAKGHQRGRRGDPE